MVNREKLDKYWKQHKEIDSKFCDTLHNECEIEGDYNEELAIKTLQEYGEALQENNKIIDSVIKGGE